MLVSWWLSLDLTEQVLLYIAVPATLVLLIQTILLFLGGIGGGDAQADADCDGGTSQDTDYDDGDPHGEVEHAAAGLHILTLRGVVAFLTLFGWSGLAFCQTGMPPLLAVFLGIPVGFSGMVAIALLLREAMRLQYDGTLDPRNALGMTGEVYLTVPARRAGQGKVNLLVQSQWREFEAVTDSEVPIPTGSEVIVSALVDSEILLVRTVNRG